MLAPLIGPTPWSRILEKPDEYPAYLSQAFVAAAVSDPSHFVDYDEYYEAEYEGLSTRGMGKKVNLYAGHWVEAQVGVIDGEVQSWFMHGNCAALAIELAYLTTKRVVVFEVETPQLTGERWVHAATLNTDGSCSDIEGKKSVPDTACSYSACPVEYDLSDPASAEAFFALVAGGKSKHEAFNDYYSAVEQAMIRHYAEMLVQSS